MPAEPRPPADSITLANGAVVRVGDVVTTLNHIPLTVRDFGLDYIELLTPSGMRLVYGLDGKHVRQAFSAIDLAKLTEQRVVQGMDRHGAPALAAPPAPPDLRGLVEQWQGRAATLAKTTSPEMTERQYGNIMGKIIALHNCANALAALLPAEPKEHDHD